MISNLDGIYEYFYDLIAGDETENYLSDDIPTTYGMKRFGPYKIFWKIFIVLFLEHQ